MTERCLVLDCHGESLVGILHEPDCPSRRIGILIVVGGPQYRVGSHRQFVLMARAISAAGYPVFRFDYRGMGDSTGRQRNFEVVDDDVRAAIEQFRAAQPGMQHVVLLGLCDAASALLIVCDSVVDAHGLVLINPWVRTDAGEAKALVKHYYLQRLQQKSFWQKLLTARLDLMQSISGFLRTAARIRQLGNHAQVGIERHFLRRMESGFEKCCQPILILLSEKDLTAREFEEMCKGSSHWSAMLRRTNVTTATVSEADHTFSTSGALESAIVKVLRWLNSR